jgi:hypothetical protein
MNLKNRAINRRRVEAGMALCVNFKARCPASTSERCLLNWWLSVRFPFIMVDLGLPISFSSKTGI